MTEIAIQGVLGRMGQELVRLIGEREDCRVVAGIDAAAEDAAGSAMPFPVFASVSGLEALPQMPDAVIDFSHPTAVNALLDYACEKPLPCIICTTGLDAGIKEKIRKASAVSPVFYSANMSLGINLAARLVKQMQAVLKGFDIEIVEKHHHNKLDAPSGTALMLADAINEQAGGKYEYVYDRSQLRQKRGANELGLHAVRGGSIVGEHDVVFAGLDEVLTLSHTAYSRNVFANGAIAAALFLAGKAPGLYSMDDLLEV